MTKVAILKTFIFLLSATCKLFQSFCQKTCLATATVARPSAATDGKLQALPKAESYHTKSQTGTCLAQAL